MLAVTAISVALVYALGRRLDMRRPTAALAVVLFGLSPLSVALQRQVYLDGIAVAWMLAAFVLALSWRRQLWQHLAAGACAKAGVGCAARTAKNRPKASSTPSERLMLPILMYRSKIVVRAKGLHS